MNKMKKIVLAAMCLMMISSFGISSANAISLFELASPINGYGGPSEPSSPRRSSGGGSGFVPTITSAPDSGISDANLNAIISLLSSLDANQGLVLGESTFAFNNNLSLGMSGNDVVELQERLRAEGFFTFHTSTGYFGPITLAAVEAYQTAYFDQIGYVTGFVGPLTRAVLNQ